MTNRDGARGGHQRVMGNGFNKCLDLVRARPLRLHSQLPAPLLFCARADQCYNLQKHQTQSLTLHTRFAKILDVMLSTSNPQQIEALGLMACSLACQCVANGLTQDGVRALISCTENITGPIIKNSNACIHCGHGRTIGDKIHELVAVLAHAVGFTGRRGQEPVAAAVQTEHLQRQPLSKFDLSLHCKVSY